VRVSVRCVLLSCPLTTRGFRLTPPIDAHSIESSPHASTRVQVRVSLTSRAFDPVRVESSSFVRSAFA